MRKKIMIAMGILLCTLYTLYAQKDSRYDAGLNLPFNEKAGDVNPQTGNITIGNTDVELPGRAGMNFSFGRLWALNQSNVFTMYRDPVDGGNQLNSETIEQVNHMGVGWSGTIPYILKDISSGELIMSLFLGGGAYEIDQSGIAVYNPDKSNLLGYDLLDLRIYKDGSIGYSDFTQYNLPELAAQYSISDRAGDRACYLLLLKDNSRLWFREDGRLMLQQDRTGLNRIWYFYDNGHRLRLVVDTIGRKIGFSYDSRDNLTEIAWSVKEGSKDAAGRRSYAEGMRSVKYSYLSADTYPETKRFLDGRYVIAPETPYVLESVTDPMGNVTRYGWQEGLAAFTYDSKKAHSQNIYMLLTGITSMYTNTPGKGEQYRNKRCFEYEKPVSDLYRKYFYGGYMEYYKLSRQYFLDRHGRVLNDTRYVYHGNFEAGNMGEYTAVIELGNIRTTYTYSLSNEKDKEQTLDKLVVETADGFKQLTDYVYDTERKKILEEVFRQGSFIYREKFLYDKKGNLKRQEDKMGLVTTVEYDDRFSIPLHTFRALSEDKVYETETVINNLGHVLRNNILLAQPGGNKRSLTVEAFTYDAYGNPIAKTDSLGNTVHTVYDADTHAFPVKVYTDVAIDSWAGGGTVHDNWRAEPDGKKQVRLRSWKLFNSDGKVWIEIDNEGYALEHYYDKNGIETEVINPDRNDIRDFAAPVELAGGEPAGADFDDFRNYPGLNSFLSSRQDNPGARMKIDYQSEFIKTYADIDAKAGFVKVTGVQKDGLGNVEEEIEYGANEAVYAVKRMAYDQLGRMVALTDPDAGAGAKTVTVNGVAVNRTDKTWIVKYDDLGRKLLVLYPETTPGKTDAKTIAYNDTENSATTVDPEGRRLYERRDWNGNLLEVFAYGDDSTRGTEEQHYLYTYDRLNRKTSFTDPEGIVTAYRYDERNLLVEQNYGAGAGSDYMSYEDRGLLAKKTDRAGNVVTFTYDEMGRNICAYHYRSNADYAAGSLDHKVALSYDNRGNAVRIQNQNLTEHYLYDHANRVITLERMLTDSNLRRQVSAVWGGDAANQTFAFQYTYNDAGMVTEMVYPDGAVHTFRYDPYLSRLEAISTGDTPAGVAPFVTDFTYNKAGVVTRMDYANNTSQTWEFDNRKRISHIRITSPGLQQSLLDDLTYTLNGAGDILRINENEFRYDGFDRITGARILIPGCVDKKKLVLKHFGTYKIGSTVNGVGYNPEADIFPAAAPDGQVNGEDFLHAVLTGDEGIYDSESFEYDRNGNRTRLVQNGDEFTYEYGARNQLTAIWRKPKGSQERKPFAVYSYDANGNTIQRTIYGEAANSIITFAYDTMNRLVQTTDEKGSITAYFYDNAGNRFIKKDNQGTTLYLRHGQIAVAMDIELAGMGAKFAAGEEYRAKINRYVLSGDLLAGRITKTIKPDNSVQVAKSWYHLDHLNSTKCVSKADGSLEVKYEYRAFGEQLKRLDAAGKDTGDKAKYSYGGKELDDETNLYYFNARYYDATIGRFINVDPVQDGTNWYVYCRNNPLNAVDPSGLQEEKINSFNDLTKGLGDTKKNDLNSGINALLNKVIEKYQNFKSTNEFLREFDANGFLKEAKEFFRVNKLLQPDGFTISVSGAASFYGLIAGGGYECVYVGGNGWYPYMHFDVGVATPGSGGAIQAGLIWGLKGDQYNYCGNSLEGLVSNGLALSSFSSIFSDNAVFGVKIGGGTVGASFMLESYILAYDPMDGFFPELQGLLGTSIPLKVMELKNKIDNEIYKMGMPPLQIPYF